ncbi:MAG: 50S ribosomal protein L29 [Candidatus Hydrogenedentota bacterium]|nr:MAG: 50S ribosomal protein L29 [Candidatus Hydrogenedentota bacterium]
MAKGKTKKVSYAELTDAELDKVYKEAKKAIQEARFQAATGSLKNVKLIRQKKKEVARVLTEKRKRELAQQAG